MTITINQNTTFLICDDRGDVTEGGDHGLYSDDTRYLSTYRLLLGGVAPVLLTARPTTYDAAEHFLTNPPLEGTPADVLGIERRRYVAQGMHEELRVVNYGDDVVRSTLGFSFDADFAGIFEVKRRLSMSAAEIRKRGHRAPTIEGDGHVLRYAFEKDSIRRALALRLSRVPLPSQGSFQYPIVLEPGERWGIAIDFSFSQTTAAHHELGVRPRSGHLLRHQARRRKTLVTRAPVVRTDAYVLRKAYDRSIDDLAALRIRAEDIFPGEYTIAAGIPWFLALFGRDSIITAYQALPYAPDLTRGVLLTLAGVQGTRLDPSRDEEPGKIIHEDRLGIIAGAPARIPNYPYYGSIDSTPLYLMLLSAYVRLTGDLDLAWRLEDTAFRAIEWMERWGDRDGDGYLEYLKQSRSGLDNQGWKDSGDSVRFRNGALARPPIALCEVQGYAYAARLGMAEVFDAMGHHADARELRAEARILRHRFNRDFWLPERQYFAEALDREKKPVDSLTSNPGHLLWTGIADRVKARAVAERLTEPDLFSGWGVRTMGAREGGYNPISYHNGTVWPHDNSLIAYGLARYGHLPQATKVVSGLVAALAYSDDHRLPELFAGYGRDAAPFPVGYPTACRPQAWASGSVLLALTAMLGLDLAPDADPFAGQPFLIPGIHRLRVDHIRLGPAGRGSIELRRTRNGNVLRTIEGPFEGPGP